MENQSTARLADIATSVLAQDARVQVQATRTKVFLVCDVHHNGGYNGAVEHMAAAVSAVVAAWRAAGLTEGLKRYCHSGKRVWPVYGENPLGKAHAAKVGFALT